MERSCVIQPIVWTMDPRSHSSVFLFTVLILPLIISSILPTTSSRALAFNYQELRRCRNPHYKVAQKVEKKTPKFQRMIFWCRRWETEPNIISVNFTYFPWIEITVECNIEKNKIDIVPTAAEMLIVILHRS